MRKYLFRIENLLLLLPLLMFCFSGIFFGNNALDIHLHDTYFVITNAIAFVPVFFGMLVLYLFHVILRIANKWGGRFCKFHVHATVCLCILIMALSYSMSYSGLAGKPRRYYDMSGWEQVSFYSNVQITIGISFIVFLLLQVVFFFYFFIRIIKKVK